MINQWNKTALLLLVAIFPVILAKAQENPKHKQIPDIPGYHTLKLIFHDISSFY